MEASEKRVQTIIEDAKRLVHLRLTAKWRICELCLEAVHIQIGGHLSKKFISIADFARRIGMHRKTLNQWMIQYRKVYIKLDPEKIEEYKGMVRATTFNGAVDRASEILGFKDSKEYVEKILIQELKRNNKEREWETYKRILKHANEHIAHRKIEGVPPRRVLEVENLANTLLKSIRQYKKENFEIFKDEVCRD